MSRLLILSCRRLKSVVTWKKAKHASKERPSPRKHSSWHKADHRLPITSQRSQTLNQKKINLWILWLCTEKICLMHLVIWFEVIWASRTLLFRRIIKNILLIGKCKNYTRWLATLKCSNLIFRHGEFLHLKSAQNKIHHFRLKHPGVAPIKPLR